MIETLDYWIVDNKFIFKPEFNKSIIKYIDVISNCDTLVFSNYDDVNICIQTNDFDKKNYDNYKGSKFNQEVKLPENITQITFGESFNQKVILPENLTQITFGNCFNQKVILPENLTHITFGYEFSQEVNLPEKLKYLMIDCNNLNIINYLPNGLEELILGYNFDLELNNLPNFIKRIIFYISSNYNKELNNLPNLLEYLELPKKYDKKISNIPNSLKTVKCYQNYKFINDFDLLEVITYE